MLQTKVCNDFGVDHPSEIGFARAWLDLIMMNGPNFFHNTGYQFTCLLYAGYMFTSFFVIRFNQLDILQ